MNIYETIFENFKQKAVHSTLKRIITGNAYTAVELSGGFTGLAYSHLNPTDIFQQKISELSVTELLSFIKDDNPFKKSIGFSVVNALNHPYCSSLPDDDENTGLFSFLKPDKNKKISMIGFIKPLAKRLSKTGASLDVLDFDKKIGIEKNFYDNLKDADILISTSSSLINSSFEKLIKYKNDNLIMAMVGPTTPMLKSPFHESGVSYLAGSHVIPEFNDDIFFNVSKGNGTPVLKKYMRKVVLKT